MESVIYISQFSLSAISYVISFLLSGFIEHWISFTLYSLKLTCMKGKNWSILYKYWVTKNSYEKFLPSSPSPCLWWWSRQRSSASLLLPLRPHRETGVDFRRAPPLASTYPHRPTETTKHWLRKIQGERRHTKEIQENNQHLGGVIRPEFLLPPQSGLFTYNSTSLSVLILLHQGNHKNVFINDQHNVLFNHLELHLMLQQL